MRSLLLLIGLLTASPLVALADDEPIQPEDDDEPKRIWFYVDDGGLVSFVDSLDLVPARYRSRAQATNLVTTPAQPPPRSAPSRTGRRTVEDDTSEPTPEPEPPSLSERLAQLRGEREEIVDELGALEEGWSDRSDLTGEGLKERSVQLEGRLQVIDREISELEAKQRR